MSEPASEARPPDIDAAAADYLAALQVATAGSMPPTAARHQGDEIPAELLQSFAAAIEAGVMDTADAARTRAQWAKEYARARALRPTAHEDAWLFMILSGFIDAAERALEQLGWTPARRPLFGTLPIGQFNALALRPPGSDQPVVAVQYGLLGFLKSFCKVIAHALPTQQQGEVLGFDTDPERIWNGLRADAAPLRQLSHLLAAYVHGGDPFTAPRYWLPLPWSRLADLLATSGGVFVIGHEYGHVIGGHLAGAASRRQLAGDTQADVVPSPPQQELEADRAGTTVAIVAQQASGYDLASAYAGADLVFTAMELGERALAVARHGDAAARDSIDTHPPPLVRRTAARALLPALPVAAADAESALELAGALATAADIRLISPTSHSRARLRPRP